MKKINKILKFISVVILFVILLFSLKYFYFSLAFPDLSLDYKTYGFSIGIYPKSEEGYHIRDYSLNYDFQKSLGTTNFRCWAGEVENPKIQVNFPSELVITSFNVYDSDTLENISLAKCTKNVNYLYCEFYGILENQLEFKINLKQNKSTEKFYPNGLFIFGDVRDFSLLDNESSEKDNVLLNFNLGDKYRCQENCFIKEMSSENLDYYLDKTNLMVYIPQGEGEIINLPHFRLNTYNYSRKINYSFFLTLLISLLAGIIVLILDNRNKLKNLSKQKPCLMWPWSYWIKN